MLGLVALVPGAVIFTFKNRIDGIDQELSKKVEQALFMAKAGAFVSAIGLDMLSLPILTRQKERGFDFFKRDYWLRRVSNNPYFLGAGALLFLGGACIAYYYRNKTMDLSEQLLSEING